MSYIHKIILILGFTIFLPATSLFASARDFVTRSWDIQSELKNNTVTALVQSKTGYIWIGTPQGLVRFDGIRFTHFNHWNTPGFLNDHITCLFEDLYGNLWIGTDGGGLFRYKNSKWDHFTIEQGLADNFIHSICDDWRGHLWVGTDNGLNHYDMNEWNTLTTADGLVDNIVTCLETDTEGELWIGTFRNGIVHYDEGIVRSYGYAEGLSNLSIYSLASDPTGTIWIGTREGLFYLNRKTNRIHYISETSYTPITDFLPDDLSKMWIATMSDGLKISGILEHEESVIPSIITDIYVRCLLRDQKGNLWAGTDTDGLIQLKESYLSGITRKNGLPGDFVNTVLRDRNGNLWVGLNTGGLYKIKKDKYETYTAVTEINSIRVSVLLEDHAGQIWVGTENNGVYRIVKDKIAEFDKNLQLGDQNIRSLAQDEEDRLWIGTNTGLFYVKDDQIFRAVVPEENKFNLFQTLYISPSGTYYICSGRTVYVYIQDKFVKIASLNSDIRCLYEDQHSSLWIGIRNGGLWCWSEGELFSITIDDGLPHNDILSIREDNTGNLWLSSPRGIIRIDKNLLDRFINQHQAFISAALFNETDGIANSRCSSIGYPVVTQNPARDTLWYATAGGIVMVDVHNLQQPDHPPLPHIEEFASDGKILAFEENQPLVCSDDHIRVHFTAFDYSAPENIYFRYRLTGLDTSFISLYPGQERIASFQNLSDGDYIFELQTANRFGMWNPVPEQVLIRIQRPFYTSTYFYLSLIALISSFSAVMIYMRRRRYLKDQSEKYKTIVIPVHAAELTLKKLKSLIENDKIYLDPDLSLSSLARKLHLHPNQLSRLINERYGQNFNDFINRFRIKEAQRMLCDPENRVKKILEILFECGFYSKSVFNTAFKKITGQTPSVYRRLHLK